MNEALTTNSLAALLNGRDMGKEINQAEDNRAKDAGLVVIFGYSDDNVELRGAIRDEVGAYEGTTLYFSKGGLVPDLSNDECDRCRERFREESKRCATVDANWNDAGKPCWSYKTTLPHATFDIMEDGEVFCRGIVIDVKDLPTL